MTQIKHIVISVVTYLLLCAIVFPSALQFSHLFEEHEHTFCGNVSTHLHENDLDCDFTKFLIPLAPSYTFNFEEQKVFIDETTLSFYYQAPKELGISQFIRARGPPYFQQHTILVSC